MAKGEKSAFLWYWMALKESISADILLTEEIKIPVAKTRSNRSRYIKILEPERGALNKP